MRGFKIERLDPLPQGRGIRGSAIMINIEIRNKYEYQMTKILNKFGTFRFVILNLFRDSNFVLRIYVLKKCCEPMKINICESKLTKHAFYLLWVMCFLCFQIESADAHRVVVFAWVEGDTVYVESKFSGGKRVKAGEIIVTDPQGNELLSGRTNENGEFSFKVPKKSELKIILLAGTGHRGEWTIAAGEIEMPAAANKRTPPKATSVIRIIIGIGCIFALTGIVAYLRKRKIKNLDHESTKI